MTKQMAESDACAAMNYTQGRTECISEAVFKVRPPPLKRRAQQPKMFAMKNMGLTFPDHSYPGFEQALGQVEDIEESAHTSQGAFGYLLSRIAPRPQLAAAMHFPISDDIVDCAYNSMRKHFPEGLHPEFGKDIIWPTDLMVLKVKKGKNGKPPKIEQFMSEVSDYTWSPPQNVYGPMADPKYPGPTAQLDMTNLIEPGEDTYCGNGH
jgi:ribonuclease Z